MARSARRRCGAATGAAAPGVGRAMPTQRRGAIPRPLGHQGHVIDRFTTGARVFISARPMVIKLLDLGPEMPSAPTPR